ncbi:hypothetical protein [Novosphingobium sp. ES2-1]|uniref:hypothetical protein n=1 Tax=Novosphingobium sp. ES2-1 TaxID=2780074 RepID=UPI00187EE9DA|nr:hypothetical protein [Novosphingobium sp. ES2-1]QOV92588.1 hypothetical protein IM701_07690 [Novosphingobium sp. ES2-1]
MTAEEIAAGLSAAQRKAVLWCQQDGTSRVHDKQAPREVSFFVLEKVIKGVPTKEVAIMFSLITQGKHPTIKNGLWPARTWALTPLGQQVRSILEGTSHAD